MTAPAGVVEPGRSPAGSRVGPGLEPLVVRVPHARHPLVVVPVAFLALTLVLGVVLGFKAGRPTLWVRAMPMQIVQPLHTLMALLSVFSGVASLTVLALSRLDASQGKGLERFTTLTLLVFAVASSAGILAGGGSGLEYITWPLILTALPAGLFLLLALVALRRLPLLVRLSPEGAWLLPLGLLLVPLGLGERLIGSAQIPSFERGLSSEWHALDTVFAGWNAALYALGILISARPYGGGRLRPRPLFLIAGFGLLSTFGHHHYASPQPGIIKSIAVVASMLAAISFVRHLRIVLARTDEFDEPAAPLLLAAERWTLFAIGSGVILAVPRINLVLHGTHAVVAHSMCSMIGVNVMLVLAGLVHFTHGGGPGSASRIRRSVRWVNLALALTAACLVAAGIAKGILRTQENFHGYQPTVLLLLTPLPVLGLALTGTILSLVRAALARS